MTSVTFATANNSSQTRRDICTEQVSRQSSSRHTPPFPEQITPSSRNGYPCVNSGNYSALDLNVYLLSACALLCEQNMSKLRHMENNWLASLRLKIDWSRIKLNFWVPVLTPKKMISYLFLDTWVIDLCNITVDVIRIPWDHQQKRNPIDNHINVKLKVNLFQQPGQ